MQRIIKRAIFFILLAFVAGFAFLAIWARISVPRQQITSSSPVSTTVASTISYKGEDGKDALTLLKNHASIVQNQSGLVVTINGRTANDSKHEFWEFVVNGKEAKVGPASYVTKPGDTIQWKIATY